MPHKQYFKVSATDREVHIIMAISSAMAHAAFVPTPPRNHSFARFVQQYLGKRYSLEEITAVLSRPINDYIEVTDESTNR